MCDADPANDIETRSLVWRLFRDAADEDYLVARHSISLDLHFQFAWSALQAIEKYLKCALLLNGTPVKSFGHDILPMFDELVKVSGELLPTMFVPPRGVPLGYGSFFRRAEPYRDFISRINEMGDANNRYRYYSVMVDKFDLHKLDETCFQLRRLCIPLDMIYRKPDKSYRSALANDPNLQVSRLSYARSRKSSSENYRMSAFRMANFSFFRDEAVFAQSGGTAYNSPLYLALQRKEHTSPALRWLLDRVHFNKEDRQIIISRIED